MVPVHPREIERLAALHDLKVLGSDPEEGFDAVCETARDLFGAPIAFVSLVAETEQWFKARCGLDLQGTPRDESFCTHTILSDEVFVVEDATLDPRFSESPLVRGEIGVRFYAGAPLMASPGLQLGSLCIMDRKPRTFCLRQRRQLETLARVVTAQLRLHKVESQLREREANYRLLADNSTDVIVRADLDGIRRYVSPSCLPLLGYRPEELVGSSPLDFVHPDDQEGFRLLLDEIRQGRRETLTGQQRYRRRDGTWVWVEVNFTLIRDAASGRPEGYVASIRDITLRKEAEARLAHLARHDPLTGLPNRLRFRESLQAELARVRRGGSAGFALHCLDLDRFKQINDSLGHKAGDTLLQAVAERLCTAVRGADSIARIGGDEFVVIQPEAGAEAAGALAERLIAALDPPFDLGGHLVRIGVSVGVALATEGPQDGEDLYRRADAALYAAKNAGRRSFRLADAARRAA